MRRCSAMRETCDLRMIVQIVHSARAPPARRDPSSSREPPACRGRAAPQSAYAINGPTARATRTGYAPEATGYVACGFEEPQAVLGILRPHTTAGNAVTSMVFTDLYRPQLAHPLIDSPQTVPVRAPLRPPDVRTRIRQRRPSPAAFLDRWSVRRARHPLCVRATPSRLKPDAPPAASATPPDSPPRRSHTG
jgi:hypothetical protein